MKKNTFNPFKLWGSYLGMIIGICATYEGTNPFSFLNPVFDFLRNFNIELNLVGGFLIGYTLHLLIRSMANTSKRGINKLRDKNIKYGR